MKEVATIGPTEPAGLDLDRLAELIVEMGEPAAERLIGRTLEDLAVRLNRAERASIRGDLTKLADVAADIADVAAQIGLTGFALAARNASDAAGSGHPVAIAATVARMIRLGEASLMCVWDLRDIHA